VARLNFIESVSDFVLCAAFFQSWSRMKLLLRLWMQCFETSLLFCCPAWLTSHIFWKGGYLNLTRIYSENVGLNVNNGYCNLLVVFYLAYIKMLHEKLKWGSYWYKHYTFRVKMRGELKPWKYHIYMRCNNAKKVNFNFWNWSFSVLAIEVTQTYNMRSPWVHETMKHLTQFSCCFTFTCHILLQF